jgi:DNA ligase D-like protein (predicted ligase)
LVAFVEFQLATLAPAPVEGDDWLHEIKYDGYRTQLIIQNHVARACTRNGLDWTSRYPSIVEAGAALPIRNAIIDGEAVVMDGSNTPSFDRFRSAMRWQPHTLLLVAFDLLHLDGRDLRNEPLIDRRARLRDLIGASASAIQYSDHVAGGGKAFYEAVDRLGLEGMVSKKASSRYRSGRNKNWLKVKCFVDSTYEVAGLLRQPGRPAIAYMVTPDKERSYVGGAFVTLNKELRERLWRRVRKNAAPVKGVTAKPGTEWLKPGLTATVRHLKGEAGLRHAVLKDIDGD